MNEQTETLVKSLIISISVTSMLALGYVAGLMRDPRIVLGLTGGLFTLDLLRGVRLWRERRDNPIFTMVVHMEE